MSGLLLPFLSMLGSNAMNRTNQYQGIRNAEQQSQDLYDSLMRNLETMKSTYSNELAGKSTASELDARNQGINNLAKSQEISQEQYAQALARAGINSSGASPTDIVGRGIGNIASEYTGGIADMDKALALAADERKSAVERAMADYKVQGMDSISQVDSQIEGMKTGLRSTELSEGTNIFENFGNILKENPSSVLGGLLGGIGNLTGGNYDIAKMMNQGALGDLSKTLGVDINGMLAAGSQPSSEIITKDPTKSEYRRNYKYDTYGNKVGYDDELISSGATPDKVMTRPQTQKYLANLYGDNFANLSPADQELAITQYIQNGDVGTIDKKGSLFSKETVYTPPVFRPNSGTTSNRPSM